MLTSSLFMTYLESAAERAVRDMNLSQLLSKWLQSAPPQNSLQILGTLLEHGKQHMSRIPKEEERLMKGKQKRKRKRLSAFFFSLPRHILLLCISYLFIRSHYFLVGRCCTIHCTDGSGAEEYQRSEPDCSTTARVLCASA